MEKAKAPVAVELEVRAFHFEKRRRGVGRKQKGKRELPAPGKPILISIVEAVPRRAEAQPASLLELGDGEAEPHRTVLRQSRQRI